MGFKERNGTFMDENKDISVGFGFFSDVAGTADDSSMTFKNDKGEDIVLVIPDKTLAKISERYGYALTDFESRDIAESISETADFYGLFINEEMITESIRICSVLHIETERYKGGSTDYSMIEQIAVFKAMIHERIDEYAPGVDPEIRRVLCFNTSEDFDAEIKEMLDNIVLGILEQSEGYYDEDKVIEAAYLFYAGLDRKFGGEIAEYFETKEKEPRKGMKLSDTAELLFHLYEDRCGGMPE